MGLLEEAAGAFAAVEGAKKLDPDAGILTEGVAAIAGFEGTKNLSNLIERKKKKRPTGKAKPLRGTVAGYRFASSRTATGFLPGTPRGRKSVATTSLQQRLRLQHQLTAASSGVAATALRWPILRPLRGRSFS